jgi:hypothetical protein
MSMPYTSMRWLSCVGLFIIFGFRILFLKGWYIIAYALGIYLLNLLLLFLSPKLDPAMEALEDEDDDVPLASPGASGPLRSSLLPTRSDDEFKPFIRRLPEFKCWWSAARAISGAIFTTFFDVRVFIVFVFLCESSGAIWCNFFCSRSV